MDALTLAALATVEAKTQQYITILFVTRTHGVELCQEGQRIWALVELGRFLSNDLEPPPHCRDDHPALNVRAKDKERTCPRAERSAREMLPGCLSDVGGRLSAKNLVHCAVTSESSTLHLAHVSNEFDNTFFWGS